MVDEVEEVPQPLWFKKSWKRGRWEIEIEGGVSTDVFGIEALGMKSYYWGGIVTLHLMILFFHLIVHLFHYPKEESE